MSSGVATQPAARMTNLKKIPDAPLHIVLVEPQIPPNTGNVARLCAATGCALHLVKPLGFSLADRDLKRAGLDYWNELGVVIHSSYAEFVHDTDDANRWYISAKAQRYYHAAGFRPGDMLVFGKETKGLPLDIIRANPTRSLRIPMRHSVRSLNLSTAVGIVAYTALAALGFPELT